MKEFKYLFEDFFIKCFPPCWDGKGKLYDQEEYNAFLTQCRMDHSKLETLKENMNGATLVEHMITNFEILNQFKTVKIRLSTMNYVNCIDLEILIKEMIDYEIPSDSQWKEIVWLGRKKCNIPNSLHVSPNWQVR